MAARGQMQPATDSEKLASCAFEKRQLFTYLSCHIEVSPPSRCLACSAVALPRAEIFSHIFRALCAAESR